MSDTLHQANNKLAQALLNNDRLTEKERERIRAAIKKTRNDDLAAQFKFNNLLIRISNRSIHRTPSNTLDILC